MSGLRHSRRDLCRHHVPCVGDVTRLGHVTINGRDVDLDAPLDSSAGAGAPDPAPAERPSPAGSDRSSPTPDPAGPHQRGRR